MYHFAFLISASQVIPDKTKEKIVFEALMELSAFRILAEVLIVLQKFLEVKQRHNNNFIELSAKRLLFKAINELKQTFITQ